MQMRNESCNYWLELRYLDLDIVLCLHLNGSILDLLCRPFSTSIIYSTSCLQSSKTLFHNPAYLTFPRRRPRPRAREKVLYLPPALIPYSALLKS